MAMWSSATASAFQPAPVAVDVDVDVAQSLSSMTTTMVAVVEKTPNATPMPAKATAASTLTFPLHSKPAPPQNTPTRDPHSLAPLLSFQLHGVGDDSLVSTHTTLDTAETSVQSSFLLQWHSSYICHRADADVDCAGVLAPPRRRRHDHDHSLCR